MRVAEYRVIGLLPLQDHRDLKPEDRISLRAGRIENRGEAFGGYTIAGHGDSTSDVKTYGDVQGGFHIPARSTGDRKMGSWFFGHFGVSTSDYKAAEPDDPAVTRTRGGAGRSATSGLGIPGAQGGIGLPLTGLGIPGAGAGIGLPLTGLGIPGARPGIGLPLTGLGITSTRLPGSSGERREDSQGLVAFSPVGDQRWKGDNRYAGGVAAVHPDVSDFPKGTPVMIFATTQEKEQRLLAMPLAAQKLLCPNFAGDPELGTYVYDLTDKDKPDVDRRAQLQSFWRVIKLAGGCSLGTNNTLAWQLSQSGVAGSAGRLDGRGLVVDFAGAPSTGAEKPPAKPEQPPGQGETEEFQVGGFVTVEEILRRQADAQRRVNSGDTEAPETTRTRPPISSEPGDPEDPPTPVPTETPSLGDDPLAIASITARAGGFLEVGDTQDVHRIGTTHDAQPVNAAHLAVDSLWKNDVGDGPLDFEAVAYEPPTIGAPFMTPVHLRWDAGTVHGWACGQAPGKWRWEAETFFTIPGTWLPSRDPPYMDPRTCPPRTPEEESGLGRPPGGLLAGTPLTSGGAATPDPLAPLTGVLPPLAGNVTTGAPPAECQTVPGGGGNAALTTTSDRGSVFFPGTLVIDPGAFVFREAQKQALDETGVSIGTGIPGQAVDTVLGTNLVAPGSLNVFGAGQINGRTLRALQSTGVLDRFGRPRAIPPPQVGDGLIAVRMRNGGLSERVPTMAQTACMGGGLRFGAYATADGQADLTGGGWIREKVALIANSAPVAGLTAFGNTNGTGSWDDLQSAEGVRSISGGLVMGGPEITGPAVLRALLNGDFHPDRRDKLPGAGSVAFYVPGGISSILFGHPSDGRRAVVGAGSTELSQTANGLRMQPFDVEGNPTSTQYSVTTTALRGENGARFDLNSPDGTQTMGMGGLDIGGMLIARTQGSLDPVVNLVGNLNAIGNSSNGGNVSSPALSVKRNMLFGVTVPAGETTLVNELVIASGVTLTIESGGRVISI